MQWMNHGNKLRVKLWLLFYYYILGGTFFPKKAINEFQRVLARRKMVLVLRLVDIMVLFLKWKLLAYVASFNRKD